MLWHMKEFDYWWDEKEDTAPIDYEALLGWIKQRRPATEPPLIAVLGHMHKFRGSALNKIARIAGLLDVADFNEVPDEQLALPSTVVLKWSPFAGHAISNRHRARLPAGRHVLNDTHFDSGKRNVQSVFAAAAGYESRIDPKYYQGFIVSKSDTNGHHDGTIHRAPMAEFDSVKVFERLFDNSVGDDLVYDIRLPFVLGTPALAYLKFRSRGRRFQNTTLCVKVAAPGEILSDQEIAVCQRFCQSIGMEYGEIDVLRDGGDGRIYIIDANNTPAGPPKGLSIADRRLAMRLIATTFRQRVFNLAS
ncbi:hypothetical protein BH10PSE6_BH10PSE6_04650 [soil metagenome]